MNITIRQLSIGHYLPIKINGRTVQTHNPRTKDWPSDPNFKPFSVKETACFCGECTVCVWEARI